MTAKILKALHEVMQECGYVQKGGKNAFHGYKYAGEADLLEKLRPAMVKAGLILLPSVTDQSAPDEYGNTRVRVEYTLAHISGETWPTPLVAQGCGNDKNSKGGVGDKGCYKAITGANKYMLFKLFQIETGDDPESAEHAVPPPEPSVPKSPNSMHLPHPTDSPQAWQDFGKAVVQAAQFAQTVPDLLKWMAENKEVFAGIKKASEKLHAYVHGSVEAHLNNLRDKEAA